MNPSELTRDLVFLFVLQCRISQTLTFCVTCLIPLQCFSEEYSLQQAGGQAERQAPPLPTYIHDPNQTHLQRHHRHEKGVLHAGHLRDGPQRPGHAVRVPCHIVRVSSKK